MENKYWLPLLLMSTGYGGSDTGTAVDRTPMQVALREHSIGSSFGVGESRCFKALIQFYNTAVDSRQDDELSSSNGVW